MFKEEDLHCLVRDFGQDLTITYNNGLTYNPATGESSSSQSSAVSKGYFYNYKSTDIDGISVVYGDRKLVLPGSLATKPQVGDRVSGEEDSVSIVSVHEIMSQGQPMCYICQCRE